MAKLEGMRRAQFPLLVELAGRRRLFFDERSIYMPMSFFVRYCTASRNIILIDLVSAKVGTGENSKCYEHRKLSLVSS